MEKELENYVNDVIEDAKNLAKQYGETLPKVGYLAGQGLCELFLKKLNWNIYKNKKETVINDLDVFMPVDQLDAEFNGSKESFEIDRYGGFNSDGSSISNYGYSILGSNHGKILNKTYIISNCFDYPFINEDNEKFDTLSPRTLIDYFDINSTKIAIDLETKQLFVSDDFLEFIKTGELKIVNFNTPYHSIIRFVKKLDEHGFYGNIELYARACQFLIASSIQTNIRYFAEKYANSFNKYKDSLGKYFYLQRDADYSLEYNLKKRNQDPLYSDYVSMYTLKSVQDFDKAALMTFMKLAKANFYEPSHILNIIKVYVQKNEHYRKLYLRKLMASNHLSYALSFPEINDVFSLKQVRSFEKVLREHNFSVHCTFFGKTGYFFNKDKLFKGYLKMKELESKYGKSIYGILETHTLSEVDPEDDKKINKVVKSFFKENSVVLANKIFDDYKDENWNIKCLVKGEELIQEGSEQKNCLAGYKYNVKKGISIIISFKNIKDSKRNMTLELRKFKEVPSYLSEEWSEFTNSDYEDTYEVIQNKVKYNMNPSKEDNKFAIDFIISQGFNVLDSNEAEKIRSAYARNAEEIKKHMEIARKEALIASMSNFEKAKIWIMNQKSIQLIVNTVFFIVFVASYYVKSRNYEDSIAGYLSRRDDAVLPKILEKHVSKYSGFIPF